MTGALATKDAAHGKSPEAFRTISEVASELNVPQHVLRFWESRFTQVRPVKRAGGRRYYRPEDVDLLRGIRSLLYHDGLTIKGVQKVLRDQGLKYVTEIGRGEATLIAPAGRFLERERAALEDDEPRYARAAFRVLERALPEADEDGEDEHEANDVDCGDMEIESLSRGAPVSVSEEPDAALDSALDIEASGTMPEARTREPGLFDDQHHVNGQATTAAAPALDAAQRSKLELLLSDLLVLKSRLRAARERMA
jgi:DNA-binding transcriptional MerR regulator